MAAAPLECLLKVLGNGNDGVTVNLGQGGQVNSSGPASIAIFLDTCQVQPGSPICRNTEPSAFVNNSGQIVGSEYAIFSTGITAIKNSGTITGSIHAEVDGSVDNARGGVLNTGRTIDLGPNGLLSNAGIIDAGGAGRIATTEVTARLEQTGTGRLEVDSDHARGRADRLEVAGPVVLGGRVEMRPLTLTKRPVTVLEADTLTVDPALATTQTHVFGYAHRLPATAWW